MRVFFSLYISFWYALKLMIFHLFNGEKPIFKIEKGGLLVGCTIKSNGKNNLISFGRNTTIRHVEIEINGNGNSIFLGDGVKFYENGKILIEGDNCKLKLGNRTTVGSAQFLFGESNTEINVGEDCMFSREISVNTSDFHSIIDLNTNKRFNYPSAVEIGDHVWIGNGVYINKGVSMKSNSIIASKSLVVSGNYDNNVIVGGNPAKIIKSDVTWSRSKIYE